MTFAAVVQANARQVANLSEPEMRHILPILREAEIETARGLRDWLRKVDGEDIYTIQRHRALVVELHDAIRLVESELGLATVKDLKGEGRAAEVAQLAKLRLVVAAGERRFQEAARPLRLDVTAIVRSTEHALMHRHESSAYRYAGRVGLNIQHQLAVGVVRGETVDQLSRRLSRLPRVLYDRMTDSQVAARAASVNFFRSRSDAERLVRTETVHAANQVQIQALREDNLSAERGGSGEGGWLKRWDATFDKRTCGYCEELDGIIVPVNEPFPGGVDAPPLHACCRCTITPWREGWSLN